MKRTRVTRRASVETIDEAIYVTEECDDTGWKLLRIVYDARKN